MEVRATELLLWVTCRRQRAAAMGCYRSVSCHWDLLVGAGAVATKDGLAGATVIGNPARSISDPGALEALAVAAWLVRGDDTKPTAALISELMARPRTSAQRRIGPGARRYLRGAASQIAVVDTAQQRMARKKAGR